MERQPERARSQPGRGPAGLAQPVGARPWRSTAQRTERRATLGDLATAAGLRRPEPGATAQRQRPGRRQRPPARALAHPWRGPGARQFRRHRTRSRRPMVRRTPGSRPAPQPTARRVAERAAASLAPRLAAPADPGVQPARRAAEQPGRALAATGDQPDQQRRQPARPAGQPGPGQRSALGRTAEQGAARGQQPRLGDRRLATARPASGSALQRLPGQPATTPQPEPRLAAQAERTQWCRSAPGAAQGHHPGPAVARTAPGRRPANVAPAGSCHASGPTPRACRTQAAGLALAGHTSGQRTTARAQRPGGG
ncbi:hypothetical protein D3C84_102020 [compost metagenome]